MADLNTRVTLSLRDRFSRGFGSILGTLRKFGPALTAIGVAKTLSAISTGLRNLASRVVDVNTETQVLQASLETVTGSAQGARNAFRLVDEFARTTPFQVADLAGAFVKLKARGLDPSRDALESYGFPRTCGDRLQARALLDLAGLLPLEAEVLDGLLWMEDGARGKLNAERQG